MALIGSSNAVVRPVPLRPGVNYAPAFAPRVTGIPTTVSGSGPATIAGAFAHPATTSRPVSLTASQVANRQVNAQLNPQLAAMTSADKGQLAAIQAFANQLLGKLQPIAGQVSDAYDQAIQQTGQLSGAAAQYLQAANPTGQVADLLRAAGAPASQQQQVAGQLGQTFGGGAGVLSFLGGVVPGNQLADDKVYAVKQAAELPALAGYKGQQDIANALYTQQQARQQLEATRPGLYQAAMQNIRTNQAARARNVIAQQGQVEKAREFGISQAQKTSAQKATQTEKAREFNVTARHKAASDFLNWYSKNRGQDLTEQQINDKWTEFQANYGQAGQRIAISGQQANTSAGRAAETARHDVATETTAQQNANTSAARAGASARNAQARLVIAQRHERAYEQSKAAATAAKRQGISPTSYANLRKQALAKADLFYYGKQPAANGTGGIPGINYGPALKQLMDGYSLSRADATSILNDFYAPGERGRPQTPVVPPRGLKGPVGAASPRGPKVTTPAGPAGPLGR